MKHLGLGTLAMFLLGSGMALSQGTPPADQAPPLAWRDQFQSARIQALRKQVASGRTSTQDFWLEVTTEGTPLVEPSRDDDRHQLVTFLWRGTAETRNVLVIWEPFTWLRLSDYLMARLEGTDVWYLTVRVPRGARFAYALAPNVAMNSPELDARVVGTRQSDPLNRRPLLAGQNTVELPGAAPQPWGAPLAGTPEGAVETFQLASDVFATGFQLSVYTPPGYQADGTPCALLLMFDGASYVGIIPGPVTLDNLIAASKIPPTVAVFLSNRGPATRGEDMVRGPMRGDGRLEAFLSKELVPWVRARYNVTRDPRQTVIGGSSGGGFAATYAALRLPEIFGNVLSQSGAFDVSPELFREGSERARHVMDGVKGNVQTEVGDDHVPYEPTDWSMQEINWMAQQFIQRERLPLTFYLDAGVFEVGDIIGFAGGGVLASTRHLRDVLVAKGYDVHYQLFVGGHDYLSWRGTLADGLVALIGKN